MPQIIPAAIWKFLPYNTVGRINFEDKKFRGFRGCLLNLEIKYPRKFPA